MTRLLEIADCIDCPFYYSSDMPEGYECLKESKEIKDPLTIPPWCPLPKKEEK